MTLMARSTNKKTRVLFFILLVFLFHVKLNLYVTHLQALHGTSDVTLGLGGMLKLSAHKPAITDIFAQSPHSWSAG